MVVPRLSEETLEVERGLRLAREGGLQLVGLQPYTGSLFTYLLAATFFIVGPKIEAGRLLMLTAGVLTIIPTYLLGRDLGRSLDRQFDRGAHVEGSLVRVRRLAYGPLVGLIAALLLALSGPHIATSSRIAYSSSLVPLFTMFGLWLVQRAISRRSNFALVVSAAAFGLAVQTHVSAVSAAPGVLAAVLLPTLVAARRDGIRKTAGEMVRGTMTVWPRLGVLLTAAGTALLMILNMVVYNLMVGPVTVSRMGNEVGRYVGDAPWTLGAWAGRLGSLLQGAALAVSGFTSEIDSTSAALFSPTVVASVALALIGLLVAARQGAWLSLLVTASILLSSRCSTGAPSRSCRASAITPRWCRSARS